MEQIHLLLSIPGLRGGVGNEWLKPVSVAAAGSKGQFSRG